MMRKFLGFLLLPKRWIANPKLMMTGSPKWQKKISKPETSEASEAKDTEQKRDVFGDKDWDICQELEDTEDLSQRAVSSNEYDMSSEQETAISDTASNADQMMEYDTETSDIASSGCTKFEEYDIISHCSSAASFSDESSNKESTPVPHLEEYSDQVEALTSTPILVRRMFTSSKQRLNESLSEVNVVMDPMSTLKKKMSESTTSIDSTNSTSTVTKESVLPDLAFTGEEKNSNEQLFTSSSFSMENLSTRQEITQMTQSRVLYRGKSPSRSQLSESFNTNEEQETSTLSMSSSIGFGMESGFGTTDLESAESSLQPVLGSHLESTDIKDAEADQSDSESDEDQEEVWVTETSEMVTSFVTETVRKIRLDEHGNEVVDETVRVLGPDGKEVWVTETSEMVTSFVTETV